MDETVVSPATPEAPRGKSRVGCLIAGVLGVGCLGVLIVAAAVAFFMLHGSRSLGGLLPSPETSPATEASPATEGSPATEASPEFPSDFGTPSGDQSAEGGGGDSTDAPLVATPIESGSLDEMLDGVANEPQMGNSRTDATLRRDVLRQIITSLGSSGCQFSVQGARVTREPDASGAWAEGWDLMLCGRLRHLRIALTPSPGGGTDFSVTE